MIKHGKQFVKLLLLGVLMVLVLAGCSSTSKTTDSKNDAAVADETSAEASAGITDEPELAPMFTLKDMDGKEISLSDYEGKFLMINFWATWCQYCDEEMPDLMAFQEKHKDEVTVLAINVGEDQKTVAEYIKKKNLNLKVLLDSDSSVAKDFMVSAFPTTFLIDPAGKVIGYIPGKMSPEDMEGSFKYLKESSTVK